MPKSLFERTSSKPSILGKFLRNRRGAIAAAMAFMLVPMLIMAGAAVDFSRIAAARTVLQAAVDTAALTGGGEWQMSTSYANAQTAAKNAYTDTGATLANVATLGTTTDHTLTISLYCSDVTYTTTVLCGGTSSTDPTQTFSTTFPATGCAAGAEYCVVVSSRVKLTNSLLQYLIPSEFLSATASVSVPPAANNGGSYANYSNPSNNSADAHASGPATPASVNQILSSSNSGSAWAANSACANQPGGINNLVNSSSPSGSNCNYCIITDTSGDSNCNNFVVSSSTPISFYFINQSGLDEAAQMDATHYTTNLMVANNSSSTAPTSGYAFYPNGFTTPGTARACGYNQNCTGSLPPGTPLYGVCPGHNLYGSIFTSDQNPDPTGTPVSDYFNLFSSAYLPLGYPPSFGTNRALTPFVTNDAIKEGNYWVEAVCPNFSVPNGSTINAPVSNNYVANGNQYPADANIFATWYPTGLPNEVAFTDSSNTTSQALTYGNGVYPNDVYPPAVSGCTPATSVADGGVTPSANDPWWGWGENTAAASADTNTANCTAIQAVNPATDAPIYTNCSLLIQDLGTNVPQTTVNGTIQTQAPDYYNIISTSSTPGVGIVDLDPVYDNTTYTENLPGVSTEPTIVNTAPAGSYPTNATLAGPLQSSVPNYSTGNPVLITDQTVIPYGYTSGGEPATPFAGTQYAYGDPNSNGTQYYLWIQQPTLTIPGGTYDQSPPAFTAHQCYNPQANGNAAHTVTLQGTTGGSLYNGLTGDNNNGTAIDPISNPQLGIIFCDQAPPHSYAYYWHDMGAYGQDLLGYYNSIFVFTCSTPPSTNIGGGGSYLSG